MIVSKGQVKVPIIPSMVKYYALQGDDALDFKAICCFAATGFFLDDETFFGNQKALKPATTYQFDDGSNAIGEQNFSWHYTPRDITFKQALTEFTDLFESIVAQQTKDRKVILPISGGLDSRTLAVALKDHKNIFSYSYQFKNGFPENNIGQQIAAVSGFPFSGYEIEPGYLWDNLEASANLNGCYADFINPRQVAIMPQLKQKGDLFVLGHWGDVLFDSMGVNSGISFNEQVDSIIKKLLKRGGLQLATELWKAWGLSGNFSNYFHERVSTLLAQIKIEDANARIRAFKSTHWAPRWTSTNLIFFQNVHPLAVPYYHDDMCKWICTVPERYLAGRQLQIEYIKLRSKAVAAVPWQSYYPCNLYNYKEFNSFKLIPCRAWNKGKRLMNEKILQKRIITRNWEIQFLGKSNDNHLKEHIFDKQFNKFIPASIVHEVYDKFKKENLQNVHPISVLLTLSLFNKLH
jgi:hypothetical protein